VEGEGTRVNLPCFRDCQSFLLRAAFLIEGQGRVIEPGCSHLVKDEVWIGLCGSTTLVVIEEREQRDACCKRTQESRDRILAENETIIRLMSERERSLEKRRVNRMFYKERYERIFNAMHTYIVSKYPKAPTPPQSVREWFLNVLLADGAYPEETI
jgi:hypothetical protein